jgi:hypothetical protein
MDNENPIRYFFCMEPRVTFCNCIIYSILKLFDSRRTTAWATCGFKSKFVQNNMEDGQGHCEILLY